MPQHRRGPWSQHEDQILMSLVNANGPHNWVRISQLIQTRSPKQCRERYHQNLKPTLNHSPITPEEGRLIEKYVNEMGKRWADIARRLQNRSDNAVKNWWNGGQNRRKRNHERRYEQKVQEQSAYQPQPEAYSYIHHHHHHQQPSPPMRTTLPPLNVSTQSYPSLSRPAPLDRPQPLELSSFKYDYRTRGHDTPMPSPSCASEGTPSLIADNGSESRSPHFAPSPLELPPLIGTREERRNSAVTMLPPTGFVVDEDQPQSSPARMYRQEDPKRAIRLPEPAQSALPPSPAFREPSYGQQPQSTPAFAESCGQPFGRSSWPTGQLPLPSSGLETLRSRFDPAHSPSAFQTPSPTSERKVQVHSLLSSPCREERMRDARMGLSALLT